MSTSWKTTQLPHLTGDYLVPCNGNKAPLESGWNTKGYTAEQILAMGDRVRAVGINTAKASLVCIDLDGPDAYDYIEQRKLPLPPTWVIGRSNDASRAKRVYSVTPEQASRLPTDAGKWKHGTLEVFWRSQQFVAAGEHPSGAHYTWDGTPDNIAPLPEEWVAFLPNRNAVFSEPRPILEIDLQGLLTRSCSELVDKGLPDGGRNNALFALAADAFAAEEEARRRVTSDLRVIGTAQELVDEALRRTDLTGLTKREVEQTIASGQKSRTLSRGFEDRWSYNVNQARRKAKLPPIGPARLPGGDEPKEGKTKIELLAELLPSGLNDRGAKASIDAGGLSHLLRQYLGDRVRYNQLGYTVDLDGTNVDDQVATALLGAVQNRGYKLGLSTVWEALSIAAGAYSYHPVVEYLLDIETNANIPTMAVDQLAVEFFDSDSPLYNAMLKQCLLGAVRRAMEPGCQMDYVCILQGRQGWGKTTFWNILFGDWFRIFSGELGDKDSYMLLHGAWAVELGEIDGITSKKESARLKNFVSTRVDSLRPPYGRATADYPRPSILVGSCNRGDFLRDDTGERRYWVVPVPEHGVLDRDKLTRLRDSIWKGALALYRTGAMPYLAPDLEEQNAENNREYSEESPLTVPLAKALADTRCVLKQIVRDQMQELELVPLAILDRSIARSASELGWTGKRVAVYLSDGSRTTCTVWVGPGVQVCESDISAIQAQYRHYRVRRK